MFQPTVRASRGPRLNTALGLTMKGITNPMLLVWALFGVPLAAALFQAVAYQLFVLPFTSSLGGTIGLIVLGALLLSGIAALFRAFAPGNVLRTPSVLVYFLAMSVGLLGIAFLVGCVNGDCL